MSGDVNAPLLWCIDPIDGTTNFAHGYPSFAVSVAALLKGKPVAACVVEFVGGVFSGPPKHTKCLVPDSWFQIHHRSFATDVKAFYICAHEFQVKATVS